MAAFHMKIAIVMFLIQHSLSQLSNYDGLQSAPAKISQQPSSPSRHLQYEDYVPDPPTLYGMWCVTSWCLVVNCGCFIKLTWDDAPKYIKNMNIDNFLIKFTIDQQESVVKVWEYSHSLEFELKQSNIEVYKQNANVSVQLSFLMHDDTIFNFSSPIFFMSPGVAYFSGSLYSQGYDMIAPDQITVTTQNLILLNDPALTVFTYYFMYCADKSDCSKWTKDDEQLMMPAFFQITKGLMSGRDHYFKVCVDNWYGTGCSDILHVVGCKEPQAGPSWIYFNETASNETALVFYWEIPTEDGGDRDLTYTANLQVNITTTFGGFKDKDYTTKNSYIAIDPRDLDEQYEPGSKKRLFNFTISKTANRVGNGPGSNVTVSVVGPPDPPSNMTNLTLVETTAFNATIKWEVPTIPEDAPPINKYQVQMLNETTKTYYDAPGYVWNDTTYIYFTYQNEDGSSLIPRQNFTIRVYPRNYGGRNESLFTNITFTGDDTPSAVLGLNMTKIRAKTATITFLPPLSDGGDAIKFYMIEWNSFGSNYSILTNLSFSASTNLITYYFDNGEPMPILAPLWFRVTAVNGLGGTRSVEIKNMTLDIPRNVTFPFVNGVNMNSIELNYTNTNPNVIDPLVAYIIMYRPSTSSNWINLTSDDRPDTTLSLTYEHKQNFKAGSEHLYRVCPANTIGTGPCSEIIHAYIPQGHSKPPLPIVEGYPHCNSQVKFTDYNTLTDVIAIAWELQCIKSNKYAAISLFSGDLYSTELSQTFNIFDNYPLDSINSVKFSPNGLKLVMTTTNQTILYLHATNLTLIRSFQINIPGEKVKIIGLGVFLTNQMPNGLDYFFFQQTLCGDQECAAGMSTRTITRSTDLTNSTNSQVIAPGAFLARIVQDDVDSGYFYQFACKADGSVWFQIYSYSRLYYYSWSIASTIPCSRENVITFNQVEGGTKIVATADPNGNYYVYTNMQTGIKAGRLNRYTTQLAIEGNLGIRAQTATSLIHVFIKDSKMYMAQIDLSLKNATSYELKQISPQLIGSQAWQRSVTFIEDNDFLFIKNGPAYGFPQIDKSTATSNRDVGMVFSTRNFSYCQGYGDGYSLSSWTNLTKLNFTITLDTILPSFTVQDPVSALTMSSILQMTVIQANLANIIYQNSSFQINEQWCSLSASFKSEQEQVPQITQRYRAGYLRKLKTVSHTMMCTPEYGFLGYEPVKIVLRLESGLPVPSYVSYDPSTFTLILEKTSTQQNMTIIIDGKCSNHQTIFTRSFKLIPPGKPCYFDKNITKYTVDFNKTTIFTLPTLICENDFDSYEIVESNKTKLPSEFSNDYDTKTLTFFSNNVRVKRNFNISFIAHDQLYFDQNITFWVFVFNNAPFFVKEIQTNLTVFYNTTVHKEETPIRFQMVQMLDYENSPLRITCTKTQFLDCSDGLFIRVNTTSTYTGRNKTIPFAMYLTDEMDPVRFNMTLTIIAEPSYLKNATINNFSAPLFRESKIDISQPMDPYNFRPYIEYRSADGGDLPIFMYKIGDYLYANPRMEHSGQYQINIILRNYHSMPNTQQMWVIVDQTPALTQELIDQINLAKNKGLPSFANIDDLKKVIVAPQCMVTVYTLPSQFYDADNDSVSIANISFGLAKGFAYYKPSLKQIIVRPEYFSDILGSPYEIIVTLVDNNTYAKTQDYKIVINVTYLQESQRSQAIPDCKVYNYSDSFDPGKEPSNPGEICERIDCNKTEEEEEVKWRNQMVTIDTRVSREQIITIKLQPPEERVLNMLNESNILVYNSNNVTQRINYTIISRQAFREQLSYRYLSLSFKSQKQAFLLLLSLGR